MKRIYIYKERERETVMNREEKERSGRGMNERSRRNSLRGTEGRKKRKYQEQRG